MIPIVIGVLGTIPKDLVKGLEDLEIGRRAETVQSIVLLRSARILRALETREDVLSSERSSANAGVKNLK